MSTPLVSIISLVCLVVGCASAPVAEPSRSSSGEGHRGNVGTAESWDTDSDPEPQADGEGPCAALSRTQCMKSEQCTLASATPGTRDGKYVCRPEAGACEAGHAQWGLPGGGANLDSEAKANAAIAQCTDRPACVHQKHDCYCNRRGFGQTSVKDGEEAEEGFCYCAGGAPPACVSAAS